MEEQCSGIVEKGDIELIDIKWKCLSSAITETQEEILPLKMKEAK